MYYGVNKETILYMSPCRFVSIVNAVMHQIHTSKIYRKRSCPYNREVKQGQLVGLTSLRKASYGFPAYISSSKRRQQVVGF